MSDNLQLISSTLLTKEYELVSTIKQYQKEHESNLLFIGNLKKERDTYILKID